MARINRNRSAVGARPKAPYSFSARLFAAVAEYRAKADIRYYLRGVCFAPHPDGGAMLMGCDGHQLAVAFDPHGKAEKMQIFDSSAGLVSAARRSRRDEASVYFDGSRMVAHDGINEVYVQPGRPRIDGVFPDVARVLPDPDGLTPGHPGAFNARYLARLASTGALVCLGEYHVGVMHYGSGDGAGSARAAAPMVTRFKAEPNIVVVTMPLREGITEQIPEFLRSGVKAFSDSVKAAVAEREAARMAEAKALEEAIRPRCDPVVSTTPKES